MKRWIRMLPILPLLILLAACAAKEGAGSGDRVDLNVLTAEQFIRYPNVFQAVQTMRSQWLRGRAPGDMDTVGGSVKVYRDGINVGGVDALQAMSTEGIAYIRYYNGLQASQRWGLGHENGVIFVSSLTGMGPGR